MSATVKTEIQEGASIPGAPTVAPTLAAPVTADRTACEARNPPASSPEPMVSVTPKAVTVTPIPAPVATIQVTAPIPAPAAAAPVAKVSQAVPVPVPVPVTLATKPIATQPPMEAKPTVIAPVKVTSKKKKVSPTVTMATAPAPPSGGLGAQGENTGRWTAEEHRLFLQGLEQHGKGWKKIASLIKSRTVVQIRTHAQKYFQKLAKARQNGEEGDVTMEGRGGIASTATTSAAGVGHSSSKRRRQNSGTKRKAISSVVASVQRESKKVATVQSTAGAPTESQPLPSVAPALVPFLVMPASTNTSGSVSVPSITTSHGTIPASALEDSLFRFLTPAGGAPTATPVVPTADPLQPQVNEVARQAGANPIVLPSEGAVTNFVGGEESPTGVADLGIIPSWIDSKEMPAWYSKGGDVDELLNEADALDWLEDTGDLNENYVPPPAPAPVTVPTPTTEEAEQPKVTKPVEAASLSSTNEAEQEETSIPGLVPVPSAASVTKLAGIAGSSTDMSNLPPLPSLFGSTDELAPEKRQKVDSMTSMAPAMEEVPSSSNITDDLAVFDSHFDDQAFVTALLENQGESSASLPALS